MTINRTINDSGVRLGGDLLGLPPVVGTGVTPAQAADMAGPLLAFMAMIPYQLDEFGTLAYKSNTRALTHAPELTYGPAHPLAGQPIVALYADGAYITRFGGAPMPFIDWDMFPPHTLEKLLAALQEVATAQLNAV